MDKEAPKFTGSAPSTYPEPGQDGKFVDVEFRPCDTSLGVPKNPSRSFISAEERAATRWIRLPDLIRMNHGLSSSDPVNLWTQVSPENLEQGQVGNCWLIAAVAALAEFPNAITELFLETDVANGRYVVKLYDMDAGSWVPVVIDDYVPCLYKEDKSDIPHTVDENMDRLYSWANVHHPDGTSKIPMKWIPHFGKPKETEMWPVLLEKAMSKFVGSYAWISGGSEPFALVALSGMPLVYCFARPTTNEEGTVAKVGEWMWCGAQYNGRTHTGMGYAGIRCDLPTLDDEQMWSRLMHFEARHYAMTAAITHFHTPTSHRGYFRRDGLVLGHAYTLLSFKSVEVGGDTRESFDWIDQDGDCVGFERVGECMYSTCNGSRWQAAGVQDTVHVVSLNINRAEESFCAEDTMGTVYHGLIPANKCESVARMWQACENHKLQVAWEPQVLTPGTRVRFRGLKKQTHLNGRLGEVIGRKEGDDDAGYIVRLVIDIGGHEVGTLEDEHKYWQAVAKRVNLQVVPGVPGARGGAVRLVLLRNPHGPGEILPHDNIHCTKWRGDWNDNSRLWDMYPEVSRQLSYEPANDGRFWMTFEDFRRTFDKVCVLTKSMLPPDAGRTFELPEEVRADRDRALPPSLEKLCSVSPTLREQLQVCEMRFDPFATIPRFLDDGTLDTRLRWEASKPGKLSEFLETCRTTGKPVGYNQALGRVTALQLHVALGFSNHT